MSESAPINYKRHLPLFDPLHWKTPVTVIGSGGVGSHVLYHLANLGVGANPEATVTVYDDDRIEPHNPPNQAFLPRQVGELKVSAAVETYRAQSGISINPVAERVEGVVNVRGVLFLCLDTMRDRKAILDASVWGNQDISIVIETRMDASLVKVLTMDPNNQRHCRIWNTWYYVDDNDTENLGGCDGHLSIGTKTDMAAIFAVEQFLAFANHFSVEPLANEVALTTSPWTFRARHWNQLELDGD